MRALAVVGEQKREPCVYCRRVVTFIELRWTTSDGSKGTSWRAEHQCLKTTLSELVEHTGEVFGDGGVA